MNKKTVKYVEGSQAELYLAILRTVKVCQKRMELVEVYKCSKRVLTPFLVAMVVTQIQEQLGHFQTEEI